MGYEYRDYSQDESWQGSNSQDVHATKWIVILTVVVFVLQALSISPAKELSPVFELFSLRPGLVIYGQIWRLVTFVFCHHPTDILGLVFGLLIFWRFGTDIERMYGTRETLLYFLAMTTFIGSTFTMICLLANVSFPLNGSFSAALGMMALFATYYPRMEVGILPMITVQLRWLVALYAVFGVYPALVALQMGGGLSAIAYAAPVLGIPFAIAYRRFHWHFESIVDYFNPKAWQRAWRNRVTRQSLKVFQPQTDSENLEAKVDAILVKIHEQGSNSLTESERSILTRASERIKKRTQS